MSAQRKKIIIIGAGPGGLSAAMLLAHAGQNVTVYEKQPVLGGRNAPIANNGYTFDTGPTFFLMKDVLEEIFAATGRDLSREVELMEIDPMYQLSWADGQTFWPWRDPAKMRPEMERVFPGSSSHLERYLKKEQKKYATLVPCLKIPYSRWHHLLRPRLLKALPRLDLHRSLYGRISKFFREERLRLSFTFQAKYIGMSPWKAPGLYSIISYIEHGAGIWHVRGGLWKLSEAMARAAREDGAVIHTSTPVRRLLVENGKTTGVELEDGRRELADEVIINADFARAMTRLVDEKARKKYSDARLAKKAYSCSTFMLYLGLDTLYTHTGHHNIFFSGDYRNNVAEISETHQLSLDPSFYVQNPSLADASMAPAGHSALYVLVPLTNLRAKIDWEQTKAQYRERILDLLEKRAGFADIRSHIRFEHMITPADWEEQHDVYLGATFNLGHNLGQMLIFRPHNEFECIKHCWLVGGGTHPGSGLPTIYESGRITASLILKGLR